MFELFYTKNGVLFKFDGTYTKEQAINIINKSNKIYKEYFIPTNPDTIFFDVDDKNVNYYSIKKIN